MASGVWHSCFTGRGRLAPPIYGRNTLGQVCPDAMTYKKGGGGGGVGGAGDKAAWRWLLNLIVIR
jgi:hypothetical protein